MGSPSNHQREIDTETIRRAIGKIEDRQRPSGEWPATLPCRDHDSRLIKLESKVEHHDARLHAGDMGFLDMRKDLQALAKAVNDAVEQMKTNAGVNWGHEILRALISWGVPVAILVIVWALVGSGAIALAKGAP